MMMNILVIEYPLMKGWHDRPFPKTMFHNSTFGIKFYGGFWNKIKIEAAYYERDLDQFVFYKEVFDPNKTYSSILTIEVYRFEIKEIENIFIIESSYYQNGFVNHKSIPIDPDFDPYLKFATTPTAQPQIL